MYMNEKIRSFYPHANDNLSPEKSGVIEAPRSSEDQVDGMRLAALRYFADTYKKIMGEFLAVPKNTLPLAGVIAIINTADPSLYSRDPLAYVALLNRYDDLTRDLYL